MVGHIKRNERAGGALCPLAEWGALYTPLIMVPDSSNHYGINIIFDLCYFKESGGPRS